MKSSDILSITSPYKFDIQHRAGTKHGNAHSLSRGAHAHFLSQQEAEEVLADNQILLIDEAMEDDGQEPEEDYDSLSDSDTEIDPRIPYRDEFSIPQDVHQKTLAEKQQSDPLLFKIRQWVKDRHKPTAQEYKLLTPDEKFYVDCFVYLQLNSENLLIRQPIPFTNKMDCRIALPESLQERVLASFHGKNHSGGNSLADTVQLKYIFPRLISICREFVFKCPRCQSLDRKTAQRHTYGHDLVLICSTIKAC